MPSGQSSCADADSEGFELLTASSGKVSISAAEMNGAGATRDHKQGEIEAITEYLAACKRQIAKEHREKQEAEWQVSCPLHLSCARYSKLLLTVPSTLCILLQANKLRVASSLDTFRAKKRQLSRTGRVDEHLLRRVASKQGSAPSSPSSSTSSHAVSQAESSRPHPPTEQSVFSYSTLYPDPPISDAYNAGGGARGRGGGMTCNSECYLSILSEGKCAVMRESRQVTATVAGMVAARTCSRITFVLGKEHSGKVLSLIALLVQKYK
jgi:hypothetical protein